MGQGLLPVRENKENLATTPILADSSSNKPICPRLLYICMAKKWIWQG